MSTRRPLSFRALAGSLILGACFLSVVLAQQPPAPSPAPGPQSPPPAAQPAPAATAPIPEPVPEESAAAEAGPMKMLGGRPIKAEAAAFTEEGTREMTARHFQEAVELLERAAKADSKHPVVWNNLGSAYLTIDKPVYAERAFKKAIAIDHNYAQAHYNLGAAYDLRFEYDKAIASYARAVELDPGMLDGRKNPAIINNTHLAAVYLVLYKRNLGSLGTGLTRVEDASSSEEPAN